MKNASKPHRKHCCKPYQRLIALVALALSGASFAAGNHAGGHGHEDEETAIGKPGVAGRVN
ncbi:MAG: hypothetical protein RL459_1396, partial [Pseudomonadota bacterium]